MSEAYTPSETNHATITLPDDGDALTATSVNTALQELADNQAVDRSRDAIFHVSASDASGDGITTTSASFEDDGGATFYPDQALAGETRTLYVSLTFESRAGGADTEAEYRLVYKVGAGSKTALTGSKMTKFLTTADQPITIQGTAEVTGTGALQVFLQCRRVTGANTVYVTRKHCGFMWLREVDPEETEG